MRVETLEAGSTGAAAPTLAPATQRGRSRARVWLIFSDLAAILFGLLASTWLYLVMRPSSGVTIERHLAVALTTLPLWLPAMFSRRLYTARVISRGTEEFRRILEAVGIVMGLIISGIFFLDVDTLSRLWTMLTVGCVATLLLLERYVARARFRAMRRRGMFTRHVVIVGTNMESLRLVQDLHRNASSGYRAIGFVGDDGAVAEIIGLPFLGASELAADAVRASGAGGVIIVTSATGDLLTNRLTRELTDSGVHVELTPALRDIAIHRFRIKDLEGYPLLYVEPVIRDGWRSAAKRSFDIGVSAVALLLSAPVIAVAAVLIKLDSRGPIFFGQERVGLDGRRFRMLKLRTMVVDAEARLADLQSQNESDGPLFKIGHDPRITRVGRILRTLSLDELPQFWNVLRNDMSVVGPRPALPREMEHWPPELHARLRAKPGITGVWQVSGRASLSFESYERLDLYYVDNWSFWHDLVIVLKTLPAVLRARGAS